MSAPLTLLPLGSRRTCRVSASVSDTVSPLPKLGSPRVTALSSDSHPSEWSAPEATPPCRSAPRKSPNPAPILVSPGFPLPAPVLRSVSGDPSLPPSSMASLLCCGPKLAACGIVLSAWGVIMLVRGLTRENRRGSEGSGVEGLGHEEPASLRKQQTKGLAK